MASCLARQPVFRWLCAHIYPQPNLVQTVSVCSALYYVPLLQLTLVVRQSRLCLILLFALRLQSCARPCAQKMMW